jgi:hypothetical protein
MGLNLGKLVGIGVGLATGNPALGAAAGSLFDSGGGGAAGGGSSGKGSVVQAFLASSDTAASEGKKELKDIQLRNAAATQQTAAIFKSYLEEKSPKDRPATGQKLYDISSNG